MLSWPNSFDLNDGSPLSGRVCAFITAQHDKLRALDQERIRIAPPDYDVTYLFYDHAIRVAKNASRLCERMGLGEVVAGNMYWFGLGHDAGKTDMPADIWDRKEPVRKGDPLFDLRRTHPDIGAKMVEDAFKDINGDEKDALIHAMRHHHEQMDGGGIYGMKGDDIPKFVRLLAIVEAYDGARILRHHQGLERRDISPPAVLKRMREDKGAAHFDMDIFELFAEMKMDDYKNSNILNPNYESCEL